jgi:hypothetical protein
MYRRILIGGVIAAAIVGAGGVAVALSGSDGSAGTQRTTVSSRRAPAGLGTLRALARDGRLLRRVAHGEVVVRGREGFVTHDVIVGTVTSIAATSITVLAADSTSETYAVTNDTRVRVLGDHSPGLSSIEAIRVGNSVLVAGTGTSTLTAKHVVKLPG